MDMSNIIFINQSTIKRFLHKGEYRQICPKKIKDVILDKKYGEMSTQPMDDGTYFETLSLGSGRDDKMILDLPRKKLTKAEERDNTIAIAEGKDPEKGKMLTNQRRILAQYNRFKILVAKKQLTVSKGGNTQVKIYKRFLENENVILHGTLDIVPTTILLSKKHHRTNRQMNLASIDLKLTADIHSTWGDFCYGSPEHLDDIQGKMYHELVRDIDFDLNDELNPDNRLRTLFSPFILEVIKAEYFLFYLWIFNYKKEKLEDKLIEVIWDRNKKKELFESIRKTVADIEKYTIEGWKTEPNIEQCKTCPIVGCIDRDEIETV